MSGELIPRTLRSRVEDRLRFFPAVALLGPRQVGKTTLARAIADAGGLAGQGPERKGVYLDLENSRDREKLADARGYLGRHRGRPRRPG